MLLFQKAFEESLHGADNYNSMHRIAPTVEPDSEIDFKEIKARFFALNKQRLQRTMGDLRQRQREFVQLLPLLFHTNHPILPGYVSKQTPSGIPDYSPDSSTLAMAKKMARSFTYKRRAYRRYYIQAIYMMGSTGTIAYSNKSDFDIWVCYDSSLKPALVDELQQKAAAIEQWAQSMDVEAHLFLVDPKEFREGQHGALSSESSGTALHYLLLEEFYRTSLLLAGRYPVWWLVPPQHEHEYTNYVKNITDKRFVHARDNIDLGGLDQFPAEEFYGATLWSLYKGINSPYKSVLKTLLMEAYASEFPDIDMLGMRFKQAIYQGENEINRLDPYLMMLDKAEEYLKQRKESRRLELIRRSFYFKVNEKLSENSQREDNWRRELITELSRTWGWGSSELFTLDSKQDWKIQRVIEERNQLMREMTHSYQFLSDFARKHAEANLIDAGDLDTLGRKLYAAFDRKAGKIDIIHRGITDNLYESHITIHCLRGDDNNEIWVVFSGLVTEAEVRHFPAMKSAYNIIEILTWCYFNKVVTSNTVLAVYANSSDLTEREVQSLVVMMEKTFAHDLLDEDNLQALKRPASIRKVLTIINAGVDPFTHRTRRGEHLTSNRTDSLRYGGRLENLTISMDQIIITSWHEVLTFHYNGIDGLFQCIQDYMQWYPTTDGVRPPSINAVSYSSYRGDAIASRIDGLFQTIMDCFYRKSIPSGTRFVMAIEWDYYMLFMEDKRLKYKKAGDLQNLRGLLSAPGGDYKHVVFDPQALSDDVLPTLYAANKPGVVQVFFHIVQDIVHTYILDERGALFSHETEFYDAVSLVSQYQRFFDSVNKRIGYSHDHAFYYIEKNQQGEWKIIRHRANNLFKVQDYINIQVIADKAGDDIIFKAYINDREYSSLEHGDRLFRIIADDIIRLRHLNQTYPIYITDIDLSRALLGNDENNVQTIHYLNYKKLIENRLLDILQT